ncbi:MAG: hypothetical protein VX938_00005, partial [Myxococcota bacterium]|nr:hypothetical protein [Myxococcota bacterium]
MGDVCADNACTAGADELICDDENGCTTDTCESAVDGGCVFTANTEPCEDGDPCTAGDVCAETLCVTGAETNPCDDGNDCTTDKCDSDVIGGCVHTATLNGVACNDGAVCTAITECQDGVCVNIGDLDCDDQNDCTVDGCSEDEGGCYHLNGANGKDCDDQDACTVGTTCTDGLCIGGDGVTCDNGLFCDGVETCDAQEGCVNGAPPTLDDGVGCTLDVCDEDDDVVTHTASDEACDNGLFCDGVETCDATTDCQTGTPPVTDDGVGCTADHCDEENDVITHSPEDSACDNGLFCDGAETCDPLGDCQDGTPPTIDDGVACTADSCDETTDVVVNMAIHDSCEEDGNPCTDTFCDGVVGCTFNILGGADCDDEDLCSVGDTCNDQGQCVGEPLCVDDDNNPCVAKECKTAAGEAWCEPSIKTGQACFTGDPCLTGGTCNAGGQCQGQPLCDDNNPCTEDSCLNGVCQIPTGISGVPCTLLDQCALSAMCSGGECVATTIKSCDDGDACTV